MNDSPSLNVSHGASGSMTGYLFQARYALLRGLEEGRRYPGHALSIEKFDDVAFEKDGHPVELIQTKHHVRHGNVSDGSADLWKTLNIWIKRIIEDPAGAANTRFVFLTTSTATDGSVLSKLRQTDESRDVASAIDLLVLAATASTNQATEAPRNAFLNLNSAMRRILVENIWVFDEAPNIINVRGEIEETLFYAAPNDKVGVFADYLEGWWFNRVIIALTDPTSPAIPLRDIHSKVFEIQENFKIGRLPLDEAIDAMPPVTMLPGDDRVFVRQMNLIGVSDGEALTAIHDYYRAFGQRSRWARENLFLDGEADRYDRALWEAWHRQFLPPVADAGEDCNDGDKQTLGKGIFRWACRYPKPLRNREEIWLSSGSFQILADSIRIGWHPDYEILLVSGEDEN